MVWESESSNSKLSEYQKYITIIEDRLSVGSEKADVVKQLVDMGLKPGEASGLVEKVAQRLSVGDSQKNVTIAGRARGESPQRYTPEKPTSRVFVVIAAFVAASVGAFLWQVVVTLTGYEVGYFALGIGFLVGSAVMFVGKGEENLVMPLISAVAALFGILFGKYLTFISFFNEELAEISQQTSADVQDSADFALEFTSIGVFNALPLFLEFGLELNMYDILWVFLAMSTAWGMAAYDS